jgi:hypothetical protein
MTNNKIDIDFINKIYHEEIETNVKLKAQMKAKTESLNDIIDILKKQSMQHLKQSMFQIQKDFKAGDIDGDQLVDRIITVGNKCEELDKIIKLKEKKVRTLTKKKPLFVLE